MELDLGLGAVEERVLGDELINREQVFVGLGGVSFKSARGFGVVAPRIALLEDEIGKPIHECTDGTRDEAGATAQGELGAEGRLAVEARGADFIGTRAAVRTVGEKLLRDGETL